MQAIWSIIENGPMHGRYCAGVSSPGSSEGHIIEKGRGAVHCHFHVYAAGRVHLDPDGIEVADLRSAVAEAREALAELEADEGLIGWPGKGACILVHAIEEDIVCVIALDAEPALNGTPLIWGRDLFDSLQTVVPERQKRNGRALLH